MEVLTSDIQLRPSYATLATAELEGSPYIISGDGKGFVATWELVSGVSDHVHYFEAHDGPVTQIVPLRARRLAEVIEESTWPEDESILVHCRRQSDGTRSLLRIDENLAEGRKDSRLGRRGVLSCLCCLKKRSGAPSGKASALGNHWLFATASEDGAVRVWRWRVATDSAAGDPGDLQVDFVTEWVSNKKASITALLEMQDGLLAVGLVGSPDIRVVDPITGTVKWMLLGHSEAPSVFAECADGRLVSGSLDGSLRFWARRNWAKSAFNTELAKEGDGDEDDLQVAARGEDPPPAWKENPLLTEEGAADLGVASMSLVAHSPQGQKRLILPVSLRVYVQRAEQLPKALGTPDTFVRCTMMDGGSESTSSHRTPSSRSMQWDSHCCLPFKKTLLEGRSQLPECSRLVFEVFVEPATVIAYHSMSLEEVFSEQSKIGSISRKAKKLYSPPGQGPSKELKMAVLNVTISTLDADQLDLRIMSAEELVLPPTAPSSRAYVVASIRQTAARSPFKLLPKQRQQTPVVRASLTPMFNDVLELEVPAFMTDHQMTFGPEFSLLVELFRETKSGEELISELSVPLAEALKYDGQDAQAFETTLASTVKAESSIFGGSSPPAPPNVCLAFQVLMPCPVQLLCAVESAEGVPGSDHGAGKAPVVQVRMVEGQPNSGVVPPNFRTGTRTQTRKPVFREHMVLQVPSWLREWGTKPKPSAVRAGWIHEQSPTSNAVVCVDIYHSLGPSSGPAVDTHLGCCVVPFANAWAAAQTSTTEGLLQSKPIRLTSNADATLWLGFQLGPKPDMIDIFVDFGEHLPYPGKERKPPNPYCVVRIVELAAFGTLMEKAAPFSVARSQPASGWKGDGITTWQFEETLELPGVKLHGHLAARPNWKLSFEVLEPGHRDKEVARAEVSLAEVLSELYEESQKIEYLQSRMEGLKSSTWSASLGNKSPCDVVPAGCKPIKKHLTLQVPGEADNAGGTGLRGSQRELTVRFEAINRWKTDDLGTRSPPTQAVKAASAVTCLSAASSTLAAGHEDGSIVIWDSAGNTPFPLHRFQAYQVPLRAVSYMPAFGLLATAPAVSYKDQVLEASIRLWNYAAFDLRQSLPLLGTTIHSLQPLLRAAGRGEDNAREGKGPCLVAVTEQRQGNQLQFFKRARPIF